MPALDKHHHAVRNALVKDGWTITHDPLSLQVDDDQLYVDLGAERVIGAEKGTAKIAVEIKTFSSLSLMSDLQNAVGQYILYRLALDMTDPDRILYLAAPEHIVISRFEQRKLWSAVLKGENVRVIGYDIEREEIVQWPL